MGRTNEAADELLPKPGLQRGLRLFLHQAVGFGFLGQLALDLAHFGQAQNAADPGRVDALFRGPNHGHKERRRNPGGHRGRPPQAARGGQVVDSGFVHGLSFHESARPVR